MKHRSLFLMTITAILSVINSVAFSSDNGRNDPFPASVYTPDPSLPGLPQENDFLCGDVKGDG